MRRPSLLEPLRRGDAGLVVRDRRRDRGQVARRRVPVARSGSRTPGTYSRASVTAAAASAPPTIVIVDPIQAKTGPVSANETGTRPTQTSQSTLDTRPSSSRGTSSWRRLVQTTCPSMKVAPESRRSPSAATVRS